MNKDDLKNIQKPELTEEELRQELSKRGYKIEKLIPEKVDRKKKVDLSLFEGEVKKIAIMSCSHLGSKFQQLTHLKAFYHYCQSLGIKVVFNCGDVVDGINVYRGHEYELFLHGEKAQRDYTVEYYPRMENGGKTFMIGGNHDHSFMKVAGVDILENIAQQRNDIEYLGHYGAYPIIDRVKAYIQHGDRGQAYARSYRMQKAIEQFAPEAKPDLYFLGHFHTFCHIPIYRNVVGWMIGCFQSQTPYLRRKNLYPEIGGLIMDLTINDKGRKNNIAKIKFEIIPFYKVIEKDYK